MRKYSSPPLPFMGNKRMWAKPFREILSRCNDIEIVVDLFGGSGILSRIAKDMLPNARVIYNDFDHYTDRLSAIPKTNAILTQISALTSSLSHQQRIPEHIKEDILKLLSPDDDIVSISSWLLFSGHSAATIEQLKHKMAAKGAYVCTPKRPYTAVGYLDGLEVRHQSYHKLLEEFGSRANTLFLCDPPYMNTSAHHYSGGGDWSPWKHHNTLKELTALKNYILFTSDRTHVEQDFDNELKSAEIIRRHAHLNHHSRYTDIMIVKI